MSEPGPAVGVYSISVAAELSGLTVRSLRLYERRGLLEPTRTSGGTRRFSQNDLGRLRRISELVAEGVNLTGIGKILDLERDTRELRGDNNALQAANTRLQADREQPPEPHQAHEEQPGRAKQPARRPAASRRAPTDGRRDQSSRPG
jgi:MerR family transcriptional regulator/heat shock protein HspR